MSNNKHKLFLFFPQKAEVRVLLTVWNACKDEQKINVINHINIHILQAYIFGMCKTIYKVYCKNNILVFLEKNCAVLDSCEHATQDERMKI